ncbi:MAG TPA: ABC-type transport auxiliary lipoprotein family protein [Gemmatimonadaceae bacterium]|nr:ABC-type transport auxiliary lipoprotein family protein [Gemmatimonadaceae bacterium]
MTESTARTSGLTVRAAWRLLPLVLLVAAGCWRIGKLPPRELYRITLPEPPDSSGPAVTASDGVAPPLPGTLGIAEYVTPGVYGDPQIVFRIGDTEYGSYPSREWAVPLGDQLGVLTERVLGRIPLTAERAVFDPPSRRAQTYIWRGTVREFEEVDRGRQVLASVRIDLRVVRAEDDSILWSGSSRMERAAQSPDMSGIVQTLSALADEVITDLATRARRELSIRRP